MLLDGLCAMEVMLYHGQSAAPHASSSSVPLLPADDASSFNTDDDTIAPVIVAVNNNKTGQLEPAVLGE